MIELKRNWIYQGHVIDVLRSFPEKCINTVMTSPPYWALRDYGNAENVWDDPGTCDHGYEDIPSIQKDMGVSDKSTLYPGKIKETNKKRKLARMSAWELVDQLRKPSPGDVPAEGSILASSKRTNTELRPGKPSAFCTRCGAWRGNLGLEPTPELFVKHLCDVFDEIRRVLRDDGTIWVNLGDSYSTGTKGDNRTMEEKCRSSTKYVGKYYEATNANGTRHYNIDIPQKSLVMIPQRFAIEMINRGWILRNTIIWHKPNPMPSSATDRFTVDFEYLYFFSKKKKYYFEQQFEKTITPSKVQLKTIRSEMKGGTFGAVNKNQEVNIAGKKGKLYNNKRTDDDILKRLDLPRNARTVWTIPTRSYKEAHFATYPPKLCKIPIKAGCPRYICSKCGKPRELIVIRAPMKLEPGTRMPEGNDNWNYGATFNGKVMSGSVYNEWQKKYPPKKNWTRCDCNAPFQPGIVLDPFMGSGTTGYVARKLGRDFVGIDMNPEYIELAWKRLAPVMNKRLEEFK